MKRHVINFGIIGCGLMGREFASAAARWCHLLNLDFEPHLIAVCNRSPAPMEWFQDHFDLALVTQDYHELIDHPAVDAVYCAVPHNHHAAVYADIICAGKHLLAEKPFGIDLAANRAILAVMKEHPEVFVRCSSQFVFYPGAYRIAEMARSGRFGRIIDVEAGFLHSSDLDPRKPINWKRRIATNGEYGCMGDLGMHIFYLPVRFGWKPRSVHAVLSKIVSQRPDKQGDTVPCETWDNATLLCDVDAAGNRFPMILTTKRIAPGHSNTWYIHIHGTDLSVEYSTQNPKQLRSLPYRSGEAQAWHVQDLPYQSAYPAISGAIFEFGFSDAIMQMMAAFCDELLYGKEMKQPLYCATPYEAGASHVLFTGALESNRLDSTVLLDWNS